MKKILFIFLIFILGCQEEFQEEFPELEYTSPQEMPENLKVAFVGDSGINQTAKDVFTLIKEEEADFTIHLGDFDYEHDPEAWDNTINENLGEDHPFFAVIGNHDINEWEEYQKDLIERLNNIEGAECVGDLGMDSACIYKGLFFVLSGVGTLGEKEYHEYYLEQQLKNSDATWELCIWHKPQPVLEERLLGYKKLAKISRIQDDYNWVPHEICRGEEAAFIATGHDHIYARSSPMSSFISKEIAEKGTFTFISGLGGRPSRNGRGLSSKDWWEVNYKEEQNAKHGAVFCIFNVDGEDKADCYFKNIDGEIIDEFSMEK